MANILEQRLNRALKKLIKLLGKDLQAAVFLLPGAEMRRLKAKFTGKTAAIVDILAFPEHADFPHPETKKRPLGEIYINAGIAKRDPARAVYLLAHGLLHLLGYTHDKKSDTLRMQRKEQKLLKQF